MKCEYCERNVPAGQESCPHCGAPAPASPPPTPSPAAKPPPPPKANRPQSAPVPPMPTQHPPTQQPPAQGPMHRPPNIPSHLFMSICVTLLCCMPLGIIAIINSAQVGSKLAAGDYEGARKASSRAMTCNVLAVIGSLIMIAIYVIAAASQNA